MEREAYRNQIFAAWAVSHTDVFGKWVRRQPVEKAEKGVLFDGGAAHGSTATLQQGRGAQGSSAPPWSGSANHHARTARAVHGAGPAPPPGQQP